MRQSMLTDKREGFSLVEVLVSVTLLSLVLMSLSGAAALGLSQMAKAKQDLQ
jgi:prepilin-type N-terminal cleavage/methylation domain-containing protein